MLKVVLNNMLVGFKDDNLGMMSNLHLVKFKLHPFGKMMNLF